MLKMRYFILYFFQEIEDVKKYDKRKSRRKGWKNLYYDTDVSI